MNYITDFLKLDIPAFVTGCFLILSVIIAIVEIIGKFSVVIGKPVRWIKKKNDDHELLMNTISALSDLQEKHNSDILESNEHDDTIKNDLYKVSEKMDRISDQLDQMQKKIDDTEMAKLKDTLLRYYNKCKDTGEWTQFESDAFWGLYDRYISHGGNSFVRNVIKPVMESLQIID